MRKSPNGIEYTHSIHIQDISLVEDFGLGRRDTTMIIGKVHRVSITANPGVWYIDDPMSVYVGDNVLNETSIKIYYIVDIGEYPPQPTLRTLFMVEHRENKE